MTALSPRAARVLAFLIIAICAAAVAAASFVFLTMPDDPSPDRVVVIGDPSTERVAEIRAEVEADIAAGRELQGQDSGVAVGILVIVLLCFSWMGVGALIVSRQPRNWAGWTFLAVGAPLPLLALAQPLVLLGARIDPGSVPLLGVVAVFGEYALYPVALLPLLFLLYPDGHVPSPRWRWAVRGLLGGTALALLGFFLRPGPLNNWIDIGVLYVNPTGIEGFGRAAGAMITVGAVTAFVAALSTAVAVTQRFRRSTGEARQRMRLLALVAGMAGGILVLQVVLTLVALVLGIGEEGENPVFDIVFGVAAFTLVIGTPAAYLVAIFRHGLWDLDIVIRKTVQYAVVVALFLVLGVVVVAIVPVLVVGVGSETDAVSVLLVSAVLTGSFLWLRPRAVRLANRIVYGRRASPYEVLSEFSERVGETYSTDDVLPRMARLVGEATGARRADIWLRVGSELRPEARWPEDAESPRPRAIGQGAISPVEQEHTAEVRHLGELLGAITLVPAPDEPLDPAKEGLVRDLAAQAGLVLRNVRLIEELRASRQRLVAAQDEERRRLERNIHDGVQQQLVALSVQLGLLANVVSRDPEQAAAMAATLQAQASTTLDDLRDLARGIYPPLLADKGLAAALESHARKAVVPTTVRSDGLGRYPQEVEAAVYFSVLEAMNNVAKYADASSAEITIAQRDGSLEFSVADDGRGFDPDQVARGTGLVGMADRLDAIGGELNVESRPGAGTTVRGSVPVV